MSNETGTNHVYNMYHANPIRTESTKAPETPINTIDEDNLIDMYEVDRENVAMHNKMKRNRRVKNRSNVESHLQETIPTTEAHASAESYANSRLNPEFNLPQPMPNEVAAKDPEYYDIGESEAYDIKPGKVRRKIDKIETREKRKQEKEEAREKRKQEKEEAREKREQEKEEAREKRDKPKPKPKGKPKNDKPEPMQKEDEMLENPETITASNRGTSRERSRGRPKGKAKGKAKKEQPASSSNEPMQTR